MNFERKNRISNIEHRTSNIECHEFPALSLTLQKQNRDFSCEFRREAWFPLYPENDQRELPL